MPNFQGDKAFQEFVFIFERLNVTNRCIFVEDNLLTDYANGKHQHI